MQIRQESFLNIMGRENTKFVIPVFQRVYSWDARQCNELWDDVMSVGARTDESGEPHFMGMLLYSADTETWNGAQQLDVIDGQQRMTTLSLLLCALARYLDETGSTVGGMSANDVFGRFLRVDGGSGAAGKLTLSFMDRETLFALVGIGTMPTEPAGRLIDNLELFYAKMREDGFDAEQLWRGLERLEIASILLGHDDSPQLVFESLNSKGMALSTADRIRNFIVVTDEANDHVDDGVFEGRWVPLEQKVANGSARLEAEGEEPIDVTTVVHAWLAGKYRETRIFDKSGVYGLFKSCLRSEYADDVSALLDDVASYADQLVADGEFRTAQLEDAERWVAGKPKELVSEYKMFGD